MEVLGDVEKGRVKGGGGTRRYWVGVGRGGGMGLMCLLHRMDCRIDCRIWSGCDFSRWTCRDVLGIQQPCYY